MFCFFLLPVLSLKFFRNENITTYETSGLFFIEAKEVIIFFFGFREEMKTNGLVFSLLKQNEALFLSNKIKKT